MSCFTFGNWPLNMSAVRSHAADVFAGSGCTNTVRSAAAITCWWRNSGEEVAGDAYAASLPARALPGFAGGGFEGFVRVGDHEPHTGEPENGRS